MIKKYKNGNTFVAIDPKDGTKVRFTPDDEFEPEFAESCDVHISNRCDNGCAFCYAGCTPDGEVGNLLDWKFLDTLHPYTEMALNLQSPVPWDIFDLLEKLKEQKVFANVTVNQNHFMQEGFRILLKMLQEQELIHGIGISLVKVNDEFKNAIKEFDNIVIHCINGIVTTQQLYELSKIKGIKVLILGYKKVGRGAEFVEDEEERTRVRNRKGFLYWNMKFILEDHWFDTISFDTLATKQLNIKRYLTDEQYERFYQGEDGTSTFFINLVDGTFGINSLTTKEERKPIGDKSIDEMFKEVKQCNLIS